MKDGHIKDLKLHPIRFVLTGLANTNAPKQSYFCRFNEGCNGDYVFSGKDFQVKINKTNGALSFLCMEW